MPLALPVTFVPARVLLMNACSIVILAGMVFGRNRRKEERGVQ